MGLFLKPGAGIGFKILLKRLETILLGQLLLASTIFLIIQSPHYSFLFSFMASSISLQWQGRLGDLYNVTWDMWPHDAPGGSQRLSRKVHVRELAEMIHWTPVIALVLHWLKCLGMKCPVSFHRIHQREGESSFTCVHVFGLWTHHSRWRSAVLCHRYIKSEVMIERISLCLHREARKHPLRCPFQHKKHKENIQLCSQDCFWPGNPSSRKSKPTSIPLA